YVVDYDDAAAALSALTGCARAENIAAANKVLSVAAFARRSFEQELDVLGEDNAYRCGRGAEMEICLALGIAPSTCRKLLEVGDALDHRLPNTRAAFLDGRLDFARVNSIVWHTGPISDETLAVIEAQIVDGALQLSPGRLMHEIMRLLIKANPEEARRIRRRREQTERRVSITPDSHGMAKLYGALTAEEGRAVSSLIGQMAATVCKDDPRTHDTLHADAFVALMHGESFLRCRCGSEDCPTTDLSQRARPKADVQLHIDLETLLGLVDDPAFLAGHGPIDPELARRIAEDATWQAIITDARKVDEQRNANGETAEADSTAAGSTTGAASEDADDPTTAPATEKGEPEPEPEVGGEDEVGPVVAAPEPGPEVGGENATSPEPGAGGEDEAGPEPGIGTEDAASQAEADPQPEADGVNAGEIAAESEDVGSAPESDCERS
ncbi:DUF222 domain-containing protein, partial [Rhodococcus sp. NPDC058481]|uniref:DUF222 domain-containing protein n=1 Tax=unclassified Rhodococcus (in: high G+C Gram-positive bacteria) TaxID=192944 RepID=UPI00364E66A4